MQKSEEAPFLLTSALHFDQAPMVTLASVIRNGDRSAQAAASTYRRLRLKHHDHHHHHHAHSLLLLPRKLRHAPMKRDFSTETRRRGALVCMAANRGSNNNNRNNEDDQSWGSIFNKIGMAWKKEREGCALVLSAIDRSTHANERCRR